MKLIVTSNAEQREAERFGEKNRAFIRALMSMQWLSYMSGGLPGLVLSHGHGRGVRLRRPPRDRRHAHRRHVHRVHGVQDALHAAPSRRSWGCTPTWPPRASRCGACPRCSIRPLDVEERDDAVAIGGGARPRRIRQRHAGVRSRVSGRRPAVVHGRARRSARDRRAERERQVDGRRPDRAAARSRQRRRAARRPRPADAAACRPAAEHRRCRSGSVHSARVDRRQHQVRQTRRHRRAGDRGGPPRRARDRS